MKALNQSEIKEIAEQMDCGLRCYHHIKTNKLLFFPANLDFDDEDNSQFWQDEIDELEKNGSNYQEIEKPESHDFFKIMEDYINSATIDEKLRDKLATALQVRKPFANFKSCIETSNYREDWFSYKSNWMQKWVKDQLRMNLEEAPKKTI